MTQGENIQIVSSAIILGFLIVGLFTRRRYGDVPVLKYFFYWAAIFAVALMLYSYKDELKEPFDKVSSIMYPSMPIEQNGVIKIRKSLDGHFYIDARVNNAIIHFLLDTGATEVLLSKSDAIKAGIDLDKLNFSIQSYTASGTTMIARANVSIEIGGFVVDDFYVYVNSSESDSSLLGMSLLRMMESVSFEGDELILKY